MQHELVPAGLLQCKLMEHLRSLGYSKYTCVQCGSEFWSRKERSQCGDPPCGTYEFIGNPAFPAQSLDQMREYFLRFFESRAHSRLNSYPVVARWRDDVLLTNASIYDFQPWVTSGLVPPPANPLVISQRCIRLNDLEQVGYSGRHLTGFEMMAHHAFNYPDQQIYWDEQTVKYCHELLLSLGANPDEIIYKPKFWTGGGNAGPCLEVILGGLELATLVFMDLRSDPNGPIQIDNQRYSKMELKVVDTGYGLERFVWASQGTPTIYDCIFPELIQELASELGLDLDQLQPMLADLSRGIQLQELSSRYGLAPDQLRAKLAPIQQIYIIADHTRSLSWMLADYVIPSNLKHGYLARMLLRRVLRLLESLGLKKSLLELVLAHGAIPEHRIPDLEKMLELEQQRYARTLNKGLELLRRLSAKTRKLSSSQIQMLYQSHGIPLELIQHQASQLGLELEIPSDFYSRLAQLEESKLAQLPSQLEWPQLSGIVTQKLCYQPISRFRARVLKQLGEWIVLDRSAFYPEGGGQPSDRGWAYLEGSAYQVTEVRQLGEAILHRIPGLQVQPGTELEFQLDWELRLAHSRHHTATHILLWAARQVLGEHVWQAGAQKGAQRSRLDFSHYQKLSPDQLSKIEQLANQIVLQDLPVQIEFIPRYQAESKHGFRLYQGGVPPGAQIRVVKVGQEVQACAGTHVSSTGEIGLIKILSSERIQDGVERVEFCAGLAALAEFQRMQGLIQDLCSQLRSQPSKLAESSQRMLQEWKQYRKQLQELSELLIDQLAPKLAEQAESSHGIKHLIQSFKQLELDQIRQLSYKLGELGILSVLCSRHGQLVIYSPYPQIPAGKLISELCSQLGLSGGGSQRMGQIQIPPEHISQLILRIRQLIPALIGKLKH